MPLVFGVKSYFDTDFTMTIVELEGDGAKGRQPTSGRLVRYSALEAKRASCRLIADPPPGGRRLPLSFTTFRFMQFVMKISPGGRGYSQK